MDDGSEWELFFRFVAAGVKDAIDRRMRAFRDSLDQWLNGMLADAIRLEWRQQLADFVERTADEGIAIAPHSVDLLAQIIESRAEQASARRIHSQIAADGLFVQSVIPNVSGPPAAAPPPVTRSYRPAVRSPPGQTQQQAGQAGARAKSATGNGLPGPNPAMIWNTVALPSLMGQLGRVDISPAEIVLSLAAHRLVRAGVPRDEAIAVLNRMARNIDPEKLPGFSATKQQQLDFADKELAKAEQELAAEKAKQAAGGAGNAPPTPPVAQGPTFGDDDPGPTGNWNKGSFDSPAESLKHHFHKHGAEVGAKDAAQYLRKAEAFAQNLRGATKSRVAGAVEGTSRYRKLGKYIDLAPDGSIVSFGSQ